MSETCFIAAVALVAVFALLLECAHDLATNLQTGFAAALLLLWLTIQIHERADR